MVENIKRTQNMLTVTESHLYSIAYSITFIWTLVLQNRNPRSHNSDQSIQQFISKDICHFLVAEVGVRNGKEILILLDLQNFQLGQYQTHENRTVNLYCRLTNKLQRDLHLHYR